MDDFQVFHHFVGGKDYWILTWLEQMAITCNGNLMVEQVIRWPDYLMAINEGRCMFGEGVWKFCCFSDYLMNTVALDGRKGLMLNQKPGKRDEAAARAKSVHWNLKIQTPLRHRQTRANSRYCDGRPYPIYMNIHEYTWIYMNIYMNIHEYAMFWPWHISKSLGKWDNQRLAD